MKLKKELLRPLERQLLNITQTKMLTHLRQYSSVVVVQSSMDYLLLQLLLKATMMELMLTELKQLLTLH
jgi:hypothetical protein